MAATGLGGDRQGGRRRLTRRTGATGEISRLAAPRLPQPFLQPRDYGFGGIRPRRARSGEPLSLTAVQEAGWAIHPSYIEGQMQGGAVGLMGHPPLES